MTLKVINPFNQEVYTECAYDTDSQVGDKIDAARRALRKMALAASRSNESTA